MTLPSLKCKWPLPRALMQPSYNHRARPLVFFFWGNFLVCLFVFLPIFLCINFFWYGFQSQVQQTAQWGPDLPLPGRLLQPLQDDTEGFCNQLRDVIPIYKAFKHFSYSLMHLLTKWSPLSIFAPQTLSLSWILLLIHHCNQQLTIWKNILSFYFTSFQYSNYLCTVFFFNMKWKNVYKNEIQLKKNRSISGSYINKWIKVKVKVKLGKSRSLFLFIYFLLLGPSLSHLILSVCWYCPKPILWQCIKKGKHKLHMSVVNPKAGILFIRTSRWSRSLL